MLAEAVEKQIMTAEELANQSRLKPVAAELSGESLSVCHQPALSSGVSQ